VSLIIIIVLMIAESVSLILTAENPQYTKYWDVSVHFTDRHSRQKCTDNLSIYSWGFSAYKLTDLWVHFARLWIESVYRSFSDDALSDSSECELQFMHLIFLNSLNERSHHMSLQLDQHHKVLWANVTEQRHRFRCLFLSMCVLKMSFKVCIVSVRWQTT
jgi:hypothetical protein